MHLKKEMFLSAVSIHCPPHCTCLHYKILKQIGNNQISYEYDSRRRLTRASNIDGTMEIVYDHNGLPLQVTYPSGHTLTYGYNRRSQRVSLADNNGFRVTYHYDEKYRLSEVRLGESGDLVAQFEYGNNGYLIRKILGNGAQSTYSYVPGTEQLFELRNYLPNGTLTSTFSYTYDEKQRVTKISTDMGNWMYMYDAVGQLIGWVDPSGDITELRYDSRGNRIVEKRNEREMSYSVNNMNQYMAYNNSDSFDFDHGGNLRVKTSNGSSEHFTFNAEGKLVEVETPDKR